MTGGDSGADELIPWRDLRLRPGMAVQVVRPGAPALACTFCAALPGKGLMITLADGGALARKLSVGADLAVSGFTGQHDFRFATRVLQFFEQPFPYALFAWPERVEGRAVRSALRVKAGLPAMALPRGSTSAITTTLGDLSTAGALVESPVALGAVGETVDLMFSIEFEGRKTPLALASTICHATEAAGQHRVGVAFGQVSRNDKLLLNYYTLSQADQSLSA
jgi:hypothetical protein